jgi:hypothetical protein
VTASNSSITLKNSARTTDSLVSYFGKSGLPDYVEINVSDANGNTDKVKFYTDDNATNGYDILDGNKKMNEGHNLYFVLENRKANKEVWNTLPQPNEPLQLNFAAKTPGKYTLSFINENIEPGITVELEDKLNGARHDISDGDYIFNHDLTNTANRFELHFVRKSATTAVEETTENSLYVGSTENQITVAVKNSGIYTVEVMDMLGRTVQVPVVFNNTGQPEIIIVNNITAGYYLVKVQGTDMCQARKVFLR